MLLIDFDNTLCKNKYDVDLTGNLELFFNTWQQLEPKATNKQLIEWLKDKDFQIFTNRGSETISKIKEFLQKYSLTDNCKGFICCAGLKSEMIKTLEKPYFLVDNSKKYEPTVLLTEKTTQWDLNYQYKKYLINKKDG